MALSLPDPSHPFLRNPRLRSLPTDDYVIRDYHPGDEQSIVSTFNTVFKESKNEPASRRLEEWKHLFLRNPGGHRLRVADFHGEIVAQSAGLGYRAHLGGRSTSFSQAVDSFVHPDHRDGLKNPGLFVRTVESYIDAFGGHPDALFFGWPNAAAKRIGKRFLGYSCVRREKLLVRPCWPPMALSPEVNMDWDLEGVGELYRRCARHFEASIVRDEAFLYWRFRDHPRWSYQVVVLRDRFRRVRGYAIGRPTNRWSPGLYVLADWLVGPDDEEAAELLLATIFSRARARGCRAVGVMHPEWSPPYAWFQRRGFVPKETDYELTIRSHDPHYGPDFFRDAWWYQLAETDFV